MRISLLLLFTVLCGGCAARRPMGTYRLVPVAGQSLLLPPGVKLASTVTKPLKAPFRASRCKVEGARFSSGGSTVSFPSAATLLAESNLQSEFDSFLTQIEQCTGSPARTILLSESAPSPPAQTLAYLYNYRPREGIVDLGPGARITIVRARFTPEAEAHQDYTLANYTGTNTTTYDVARDHAQVSFHLAQTDGDRAQTDTQLEAHCRRLPYYRLFLLSQFVPKKIQRPAMLIGADSRVKLAEFTQKIRNAPEEGCTLLSGTHGSECVEFTGRVTISVQISVNLNGKTEYFPLGATLRSVLAARKPANPATVRVQRLFDGKSTLIELLAGDPAAMELALAGGDQVSW
jgi:hypothetical protein